MQLWTIQTEAAYRHLETHQVLRGRKELLDEHELGPYAWIVGRMSEKLGKPTFPDAVPVWAWYQWEGQRKRPDLRSSGHLPRGEAGVRIGFEASDERVLLSDFDLWHYVLNHSYLPTSERDDAKFESELERNGISSLDRPLRNQKYEERMVRSWSRIFDIDWVEEYVTTRPAGKSIQATLWEIRMDQVTHVTRFKSR